MKWYVNWLRWAFAYYTGRESWEQWCKLHDEWDVV